AVAPVSPVPRTVTVVAGAPVVGENEAICGAPTMVRPWCEYATAPVLLTTRTRPPRRFAPTRSFRLFPSADGVHCVTSWSPTDTWMRHARFVPVTVTVLPTAALVGEIVETAGGPGGAILNSTGSCEP